MRYITAINRHFPFCNYLSQFKKTFSLICCQFAVILAVLLYIVATQFAFSIVSAECWDSWAGM